MPDRGAKYADKRISEVDRKLRQTYKQAQEDLRKKLKEFDRRYASEDKKKKQKLANGEITEQQYKDWLSSQVFRRGIWEQKIKQVEQVMLHHNQYAMDIVNNSSFDVFAENYYSEAFKASWILQGIDFSIYNTQAIQRLIESDPQLLPEWKIDQKKDYTWNYQKVNNIIKQGIIQGEGVEQITKRLCEDLSTQNENRMRLFARTAITGAQNAGRQVQMNQAADMGIEVNKRWIAVMDSRTRDSHRALDGEEVPYDDDFSNGLEFPGDPSGDPAEVYNCRCTMISVYPKYEDRSKKWREGETIDGVPYEEWKEGAKAGRPMDNMGTEKLRQLRKQNELLEIEELAKKYGIKGDVSDPKVQAQVANALIDDSGYKLLQSKWNGEIRPLDRDGIFDGQYNIDRHYIEADARTWFETFIHEQLHSRSNGLTFESYIRNRGIEEACAETLARDIASRVNVYHTRPHKNEVAAFESIANLTEFTPAQLAADMLNEPIENRYKLLKGIVDRYVESTNAELFERGLLKRSLRVLGGARDDNS